MLRLRATKSALEALVGEARALALGTSFPSMTSTSSAVVSSSSSNTSHSNASFSSSSYSSSSSSTKGPEEERECSTSATTRDESALFALDCPTFSMTTSTAAAEPTLIIGGRWNEAFASSSSCSVLSPSQSASATSSAYHGLLWQQQRRWMAVPKKKSSLHRRGMRNAGKYVRRTESIAKCSRCSALMHPMQVPHSFCDDDACPSKLAGGGKSEGGGSGVATTTEAAS